jgi:hypothetical protein
MEIKTPHYQNNRYPYHTNTRPLTFLFWYRHFTKRWLGWPLWNIFVTNDHGYVPLVVNISPCFLHSRLITRFVTRLTRRVSLKCSRNYSLFRSPPIFSGVRVTRSLVLYVCFVDRCVSFCTFSFGHCVVCSSSIYGFWLPLWYLQTLLLVLWAQTSPFTEIMRSCKWFPHVNAF